MTATTLAPNAARKTSIQPHLRFKNILAPVDFSPASKNGLNFAVRCAEEFGAELTLLYVLEPPPSASYAAILDAVAFGETEFAKTEKRLRALAASIRSAEIETPRWKVCSGLPSHEIVEAAKEGDVDLIVIATHGYTGWKHFCIGSTAERVVRAAPCPVLVVREKEHEFV